MVDRRSIQALPFEQTRHATKNGRLLHSYIAMIVERYWPTLEGKRGAACWCCSSTFLHSEGLKCCVEAVALHSSASHPRAINFRNVEVIDLGALVDRHGLLRLRSCCRYLGPHTVTAPKQNTKPLGHLFDWTYCWVGFLRGFRGSPLWRGVLRPPH
eukprot:2841112-Amphidinium_carterae.2